VKNRFRPRSSRTSRHQYAQGHLARELADDVGVEQSIITQVRRLVHLRRVRPAGQGKELAQLLQTHRSRRRDRESETREAGVGSVQRCCSGPDLQTVASDRASGDLDAGRGRTGRGWDRRAPPQAQLEHANERGTRHHRRQGPAGPPKIERRPIDARCREIACARSGPPRNRTRLRVTQDAGIDDEASRAVAGQLQRGRHNRRPGSRRHGWRPPCQMPRC